MDRNREARRGSMAAMNGGLSRRRQQRSANLRDSPEEDGVMEMRESSRLRDRDRDRGIKKDRDRSGGGSRSKRRRGERLIHGSNRDEGDDSSEESLDDEDDDEEEEAPVSVRFPPPPPPPTNPTPSSSSSLQQQQQQQSQNNHVRKSITSKPARPPTPSWKVAEEMIGVSIPRKARTSSLKRPQECGGGGGSGELIHRQASTSPSRRSPSSNTAVSPSSSNVSVRKKKQISGSKHRPPKSKSSSIQEIEIEVAEVLYGMTRQAPAPPPVLSSSRQDTNGLSNEAKSIPRVSSPGSFSPPPPTSSQPSVLPTPNLNSSNNSAPSVTTAPKRKRPRLKLEDESPTSPATKPDTELPGKPEEGSAPVSPLRSEKKMAAAAAFPAVENGSSTVLTDVCAAAGGDHMQDLAKPESSGHVPEQKDAKEEIVLATASKSKEAPCSNLNAMLDEATVVKDGSEAMKVDSPREEKFSIDLMAPPPPSLGNSERDGSLDYASDHKPIEQAKEMRLDIAKGEMEKPDRSSKQQEAIHAASAEDIVNKHVATEKPMLDLQLDLEKQDKDKDVVSLGSSSKHQQQSKQQPKMPRIDPKQEKKAQSAASLPLTMPIAGWPGGFPHFGYMGQVPPLPAVMPMDGSSAASKTLQPPHFFPPQKMKRCATHCYIAKTINYNQQIARMNIPFWPPAAAAASAAAAVGTSPMYAAKQHNLNLVPPSEAAILGNPLQGSFPGRSLGPLQDKASPAVAMTYAAGPPAKEKSSAAAAAANNPFIEAQRKQLLLQQQIPQPVSSAAGPNMLHGPAAFIFPIGQQPAAAAAAAAAAATRSGTAKSTPVIGNAAPSTASGSSIAASSGPAGHSTTSMSYYAGLQPNEAQYLAFLQNNGYAFPMPAHLGGGPPYRGANPSQAMPFFNGSFYSSPMLHPSSQQQFRQQQQQQQQQQSPSTHQQPPAHSQQGHQNTSTSSGSSSSQKHHTKQQQRVPGGGAAAGATPAGGNNHNFPAKQHLHLLPPQARQLESDAGCEDSPSTADSSRASQAQKSIYGNFAMSIHPQNFALLSPAAAAAALPSSGSGGGGSHNEKQQPVQNHANLSPSPAYAMSFAPFGGPAAAAAAGSAQGLDFTSMVQNHALFHSLPEAARHHGYQQITAVATAAVAAQAAQHKKSHHEDGKSVGDAGAVSANVTSEEGKMMASTGKSPGGVAQHSLSFSRPDNDLKTSTILGNSSNIPEGSSRTLNLIQPPANGVRASNRPSSAAPATSSPVANAANPTASNLHMHSSQQQHLIQLQKLQQQQQQLQQLQLQQQMSSRSTKGSSHSTNNATTIYSDRMAAGSMSRFSGFPPSIIQSASPAQSPQWKASGRSATPGPANSAATSSSSAKNQLQQQQQQQHQHHQQGRNQQQHQQALLSSNVHQTQISFGVSSSKAVGVSGQPHLASNSSLAAASAAGSPQGSVSKSSAGNGGGSSGGNGSPRASSSSKSGQPPPTLLSPALPLHQQQTPAAKNSPSPSSSNLKSSSSSPANNRNMTSILGHPQITPATNSSSSTKFQQQSQQQQQLQQKQQSFHQPQLFFNPYIQPAQSSQSNAAAAAANYYQQQRRHSEQQSQQHSQQSQSQQQQQNSTNSGVLSLCPSSLTLAGSSPTSDPAKAARPKPTADQKAAPGSENLHWKPEKR